MTDRVRITAEQFAELFPDCPEYYDLLNTPPRSWEELIKYYLPSKLWRLNNLYYITDKYANPVKFRMNLAQFRVHAALRKHPRLIILKSRQQGISTYFLVSFFDDAVFRSHLNIGLMAQGKDEAEMLLERVKFAWNRLHDDYKNFLGLTKRKDSATEFAFSNNSTIFIRTSFRSATLQRLHISEFGKIANAYPQRAKETKTGTLQTLAPGNIGVIESTAEGLNTFKEMYDQAEIVAKSGKPYAAKDFMPVFLSWLDDPTCRESIPQEPTKESDEYFAMLEKAGHTLTQEQKNFWIAQYRELGGDIYQEYPATPEEAFRASRDGTYWARFFVRHVYNQNKILPNLFDPNLPVYATVDSGRHDYFVYCFFQLWRGQYRIIGEFWNNGEQLGYYADYLKTQIPKEWKVKLVFLPHDFAVTDISEDSGRTRQEVFYDHGITNTIVLPRSSLDDGIELVRAEIPYMYLDESCTYLEKCFMNFSKKWDEATKRWLPEPVKSEWRHGADAIRYMCQAAYIYLDIADYRDTEEPSLRTPISSSGADGVAL